MIAFYAANRLGAVPAMVHPLSTAPELTRYLDMSRARIALTLDAFYASLAAATPQVPLETIVLARIPDYLPPLKRLGFALTRGRKIAPVPRDARVRWWSRIVAERHPPPMPSGSTSSDPAAILFSGGTTGEPAKAMRENATGAESPAGKRDEGAAVGKDKGEK